MVIDQDLISPVNPEHYKHNGKEAKDLIRDFLDYLDLPGYESFIVGCALKYIARFPFKGEHNTDLAKAQEYLEWLKI